MVSKNSNLISNLENDLDKREEIIIKQELELIDLRSKLGNVEDSAKEYILNKEFDKLTVEIIETKNDTIQILKEILYKKFNIELNIQPINIDLDNLDKEELIKLIRSNNRIINDLRNNLNNKECQIEELKNKIKYREGKIGEFKNSIIYPFFNLTRSIGKTRIGKLLQKLLK